MLFFRVVSLDDALAHRARFEAVPTERIGIGAAAGRVLGADFVSPEDLPGFRRSIMDGFAVQAVSTFGASETAPALVDVVGSVSMGAATDLVVGRGQAARIPTGGMLPGGADAVVMIEHTEALDEDSVEIARAVAPGQNVVEPSDDVALGACLLRQGRVLRAADIGLLAALGATEVCVFRRPRVAILSTGDEVMPLGAELGPGQVRDVNAWTLSAMVQAAGGVPVRRGIVADDEGALLDAARGALEVADMVLISGGSSVGTRDLTIETLEALPDSEVLVHGVAIKPGKPTILARVGGKAVWGLPGHVTSAMVVFEALVRAFVERIAGVTDDLARPSRAARISRDLPSEHGRVDHIRVRLEERGGAWWAVPLRGGSALIRTMVQADGLVRVDRDTEGLREGEPVEVQLWR